jgi:hypothetical protein
MNVFVKPCLIDGKPALVRDPANGKPLAADGEWKSKTQFWIRRIVQNDVIDMTEAQTAAQAKGPVAAEPPAPIVEKAAPALEKLAAPMSEKMSSRGNPI